METESNNELFKKKVGTGPDLMEGHFTLTAPLTELIIRMSMDNIEEVGNRVLVAAGKLLEDLQQANPRYTI